MRSKSFWEKKLAEATDRLEALQIDRATALRHLEYRKSVWKNRHRLNPMKRELAKNQVDTWASQLAKIDRDIRKLTTTKIPYYEQMLAQEPRTVWSRIRTGDGLRV